MSKKQKTTTDDAVKYGTYVPTPEQIRTAALAIQEEWSQDRRDGRDMYLQSPVTIPIVGRKIHL